MKLTPSLIKETLLSQLNNLFLRPLLNEPRKVQLFLGAAAAVTGLGYGYMGNSISLGFFLFVLGLFAISVTLPRYRNVPSGHWSIPVASSALLAVFGLTLVVLKLALWALGLALILLPLVLIFFIVKFMIQRRRRS